MAKTYRVTSEIVNFSLVEPDETAFSEVVENAKVTFLRERDQLRQAMQHPSQVTVTQVSEEEEEDGPTMLGRLCAEYYRNA